MAALPSGSGWANPSIAGCYMVARVIGLSAITFLIN